MRVTGPASAEDLFWNFARAEFEVPPEGPRHTPPTISAGLRERIARDERGRLSPEEWGQLRKAVLSTRSSIVIPLLGLVQEWFLADLEATDFEGLRVMNLRIFSSLVPTRRLVDLSDALERGTFPAIWDPRHYRRLRADFDLAKMHGNPIVVGERLSGPFTLVEGTSRMSVLAAKRSRGEIAAGAVPVLLGIGEPLAEWEWY